jgi:hypothetical protein
MSSYSPILKSPQGGENFNNGQVLIEWNSATEDTYIYEVQYTDDYSGENTTWNALKKRIPSINSGYTWIVGKKLKTSKARVRVRGIDTNSQQVSEWSMSSGDFSINTSQLIAPAIISPMPYGIYNNIIYVTLDDSLIKNTYNQKVSYNLHYSSSKLNIDWTSIINNLPPGYGFVRWNISELLPSDDYMLRLTASDNKDDEKASQIVRSYVYNINIKASGSVLIDTVAPESVIQFENNRNLTNERNLVVNVFAYDKTSGLKELQLRECQIDSLLKLGMYSTTEAASDCASIADILGGNIQDFTNVIGKTQGFTSKILWELKDENGHRKIEALLSDYGGNMSISPVKTFMPILDSSGELTDFLRRTESRQGNTETASSEVEVVYVSTSSGELWLLEPYGRLIWSITGQEISRIFDFNDIMYICTYNSATTVGSVYQYEAGYNPVLVEEFSSSLSRVETVSDFGEYIYFGLENGKLIQYLPSSEYATTFVTATSFDKAIKSLYGDAQYLYIGFENSQNITLYDGSEFLDLAL